MLFVALIFVLFRGLRWEIGTDWEQFHDLFYKLEWSFFETGYIRSDGGNLEMGYMLLNLFIRDFIYNDYTAFLIILSSIMLAIYYNCSWKYFPENPVNVFICILLFEMFFPNRHGFACSIVFFSYRYILTKEFIKFAFTIAIATSIHISSVLILPFYFLLNRQFSIILLVMLFFASLYMQLAGGMDYAIQLVATILAPILGIDSSLLIKIANYTVFESYSKESGILSVALMIIRAFVLIWLFYSFKDKFKENGYYNLFYNCFFIALFIGIVFKFQLRDILRMQLFFYYGTAILFGAILGKLFFVKNRIFSCFIFLYAFYSYMPAIELHHELYFPYKTIFGG